MAFLKSITRSVLLPIIRKTHLAEILSSLSTNQNLILNYHGVVKNHDASLSRNHLPIRQFEDQMIYFKRNFEVTTVEEIFKNKSKNNSKRKQLAITFDDGYLNNLESAYPILNNLNLPATIFVTGQTLTNPELPLWYDLLDLLNSKISWKELQNELQHFLQMDISKYESYSAFKNFVKTTTPTFKNELLKLLEKNNRCKLIFENINKEYWQLMGPQHLQYITKNNLIEIGSHGLTHSNLDCLSEADLFNELNESRSLLSNCIQKKIDSLAFPDGAYNEIVKSACRNSGYRRMLAVKLKNNAEKQELDLAPRLSISNTTTSDSIIIQANLSYRKIGF